MERDQARFNAPVHRLRQLLARSSSHDAAEQQRLQPPPEEPAGEVEEELGGDFEDFLGLHDDVDALARHDELAAASVEATNNVGLSEYEVRCAPP